MGRIHGADSRHDKVCPYKWIWFIFISKYRFVDDVGCIGGLIELSLSVSCSSFEL